MLKQFQFSRRRTATPSDGQDGSNRAVAPLDLKKPESEKPEYTSLAQVEEAVKKAKSRPSLSLKARAVNYLSRREHSRLELTRKLALHAESEDQVSKVLDDLAQQGFFSETRFAESLVTRRAARFGTLRVRQEMQQHRLSIELMEPLLADLKQSEISRAQAVWFKRFGAEPRLASESSKDEAVENARQQRFLAQRGFSAEAIQVVLRRARQSIKAHDSDQNCEN